MALQLSSRVGPCVVKLGRLFADCSCYGMLTLGAACSVQLCRLLVDFCGVQLIGSGSKAGGRERLCFSVTCLQSCFGYRGGCDGANSFIHEMVTPTIRSVGAGSSVATACRVVGRNGRVTAVVFGVTSGRVDNATSAGTLLFSRRRDKRGSW